MQSFTAFHVLKTGCTDLLQVAPPSLVLVGQQDRRDTDQLIQSTSEPSAAIRLDSRKMSYGFTQTYYMDLII